LTLDKERTNQHGIIRLAINRYSTKKVLAAGF
jgi:hypothetical protein